MSNRAWVTLATNDSYGLGALVLAHSLRRAGSAYPAVVLITPSVTDAMRDRLGAVFAEVITVDVLDSRDAAHLALLQRPELGITFTKIHCWSLTQYEKCVFLDADTLIIQNCDELFEREELSAAPDVGWPDCFNSGVFVFVPSADTYSRLITFAQERGSFDGGDQGLLNAFFSDWAQGDIKKHLPFLYNVTSAAIYSYIPALKHYGQNLKIIHFIGAAKPWLQQFNWESRSVDASSEHLRQFLQIWWDLFVGQVHTQLDTSMDGTTEVSVEEAPPVLPPADVQQHYAPKLDPKSEFPWHHPDVQTQNTATEAHTLDMSQFYDPWEVYKGSPQRKEHSSSRHAEYHPEDSKKDTKIHPWTHQTSQYVSSQPQTQESNPQSSWPQQNPQSYHNPDQQQYQVQIHQPHYQQQSHYDHTHHQQVDHSRHIPDQFESCHQHTQPSSQNCPEKSNEHHGPYQEHVHSQQQSDHSHNNKSFNLPQHNNDHSQHVQTQIPTNLSGGYEHTQQSHDHVSQPHNQQSHQNNEGQRESVHNEEHGHNHGDPQVSSADTSPKQNENRPEQHDYVHMDFHAIQQERVERVFHLHLDGARRSRRNRTMNGNHAPLASGEIMNGHVSESDGENDEDFRPRHPYDGFYLRHISTVDARGHKICSHEIPPTPSPTPSPPETPPLLVSPSPTPTTDEFVSASDGEEQTGVAGNLARVVPGELGYQREALDELSRRQGWEAGNIDYMGADSFANIWAKISQTLNQPRTSPPKQPSPPKEQPQPAVPQEAAPAETPAATDASAPAAAPASVEAPVPAQEVEAPAPVEAVAPVEAPAPAEAPASVDTPAPVEAAAPVETLAPVDAPAPTEALPPVEAAAPADAPAPPEIPAPVEATSPTEAPAPTAAPVSTEAPAPVEAPVPADASAPVEAPAAADTVTVDAPAPSVTPAPASSEAPAQTEVPSTAEIAPAIEAPATSDVAAPVESPVTAAIAAPVAAPAPVEATPTAEATPVDAAVETKAATTEPAPAEAPKSEVAPAQTEPASAPAESELPKTVEPAATSEPAVEAAAPKEEVKEKTEIAVPPTPPVTPKSTPESSTPVTEIPPQLEAASETQSAPAPAESPKAAKSEAAPTSPAPAAIAPEPAKLEATPEKALDTFTATAASTDSPPLVQTPSKEAAPAVPAAKSEERRKPAGKLQLSPPAAADPLPTPDSEQEDAAALAQSIIASELSTCVTSPSPSADPASPPPPAQDKRLAVEGPEVPSPPVSLAQIGVKTKGKATTAAQIESSVSEKAEPATPPTPTPAEPSTPTEAPKKKVVKKVVKKEAGSSGDVPSPVPPPRKKEKKPKEK